MVTSVPLSAVGYLLAPSGTSWRYNNGGILAYAGLMANDIDLLSPVEAAALLHRHPRTLQRWANLGYGAQPIHLGRKLAYRRQDIVDFLDDLAEDEGESLADCIAEWHDRVAVPGAGPAPAPATPPAEPVRPRSHPVTPPAARPAPEQSSFSRGFRPSTGSVARPAHSESIYQGIGEPVDARSFQ